MYFQKCINFSFFFLFSNCLSYISWVGLVRSSCLDVFETECSEKETRGLLVSRHRPPFHFHTTNCLDLLPSANVPPQSSLRSPSPHTVNQKGLFPSDKRNPTLAIGQTVLGRSALSSPPTPPPPIPMLLLIWQWYTGDSQRGDGSPQGPKHVGLLRETAGQAKETYTLTLISYTHSRATISHAPLGLARLVTPPCVYLGLHLVSH